jgi:transcriptional regulator with XRE-family HTH domain
MEKNRRLGRAFRLARVAMGFRQIDLAQRLRRSTSTVSLIESGFLLPDKHEVARILAAMGLDAREFRRFRRLARVPIATIRGSVDGEAR